LAWVLKLSQDRGNADWFAFQYDQGVTGGLLDLPSFTKYFPAINPAAFPEGSAEYSSRSTNQGIAVASYNLGCFLGAVFTIFVGNPLGRRRTIFVGSIIMTVGALLQCTSYNLTQLIIGRIVTGWGNGMNTSVCSADQNSGQYQGADRVQTVPTWQSETAQSHQRGKLVMIEGMLIVAGICLSYWINYGAYFCRNLCAALTDPSGSQALLSWARQRWRGGSRLRSKFCSRWSYLGLSWTCRSRLAGKHKGEWLPTLSTDTECYRLVMKGKHEEALDVLTYLNDRPREDPRIQNEFEEVLATVEEMAKGSYRSLFEMTEYREFHRVVLAYVNQMFQQISGYVHYCRQPCHHILTWPLPLQHQSDHLLCKHFTEPLAIHNLAHSWFLW
jgi:hypothetical protein